jgi:hypothetical protein
MEFPVVKIASNPRHLGKLKKGGKVRLCGGDFPLALHPDNHKKVMKAFMKGKGIHIALSPEEIKHNHGKGFFDDIGNAFKSAGNYVNDKIIQPAGKVIVPIAKEAGKVVLPYAKDLANKGIDMAEQYAPELAGSALAGLATFTGNPELAPLAYTAGSQLGKAGGKYLSGVAHSKVNEFDPYRSQEQAQVAFNPLAPPSRQPQVNSMINAFTGQDLGRLDKASMGSYLANLDLSSLESLVQQKRQQLNAPHFDYSGGKSLSQFADAVPPTGQGLYGHGLYGGTPMGRSAGRGLYGGGLYGGDIGDDIYHGARNFLGVGLYGGAIHHPRRHRPRMEKGSVGIQGNLLGATEPPALQSQAYSSNFQFNHTLPPAFQRHGVGSGLF